QELRNEAQATAGSEVPSKEVISAALQSFQTRFDKKHAGFLPAPKFPSPPSLDFLLRKARIDGDKKAQEMVFQTLTAMALGGIRDHLAGGFHRYSTDEEWLVPHFEKMLYDQAQLVSLYSQAYSLNEDPLFREAAESTLSYLDRDMRSPQGAYYSAEDADSEIPGGGGKHAEGAFYVWSYQELKGALSDEELAECLKLFQVSEAGNASGDVAGELDGKNVLKRSSAEPVNETLRAKLLEIRKKRPRPHRDEKILTEWNALAAAALADAGRYLSEPARVEQSAEVLEFIEKNLTRDGSLKRSFFDGKAEVDAFCSDYVALVHAYLSLYQAGGETKHLLKAVHWQEQTDKIFWDETAGGYFDTRPSTELPVRRKSFFDGAEMSANTRAALNLTSLYELTGDQKYQQKLETELSLFTPTLETAPSASPGALSALLTWYSTHESVIVVSRDPEWWRAVSRSYVPQRVQIRLTDEADRENLIKVIPFLPSWSAESRAYRCRDFACGLPETSLNAVKAWNTEVDPAQP
ncbi:MAG: thioredoxin domain-containing protein, partial [Candidatus Eremiobacteraeota bacterium]|nr:thioredoxin domain-containing protein [Candidatus Eremiobacteraeota bacterium]